MTVVPYVLDPNDPRAPTETQWEAMSEEERARVVASLPSEPPCDTMPEGDRHRRPKELASQALGEFFRSTGRRVYLSSELPVYYPGERYFAPDLIAVLDAEAHPRETWTVSAEGKGLDFVLEVTLSGDRDKDLVRNVTRYARLGIPEYFILDLHGPKILGYRLPGEATKSRAGGRSRRVYKRVLPQHGRWRSEVLGLDLMLENDKLRFYTGTAPLLETDELLARISSMVDRLVAKEEALARELEVEKKRAEAAEQRAQAEAQRAEAEAQRAEAEAQRAESAEQRAETETRRALALAARLRALGVDPDQD